MLSFQNGYNCNFTEYTSSLPRIPNQFTGMDSYSNKQIISDSLSEEFTAKKHFHHNASNIHKSRYYQRKSFMVQQMHRIDQIHQKIQKVKAMQLKAIQNLHEKKQIVKNQKMKIKESNRKALRQNVDIEKKCMALNQQYTDVIDLICEVENVCGQIKRTSAEVCE